MAGTISTVTGAQYRETIRSLWGDDAPTAGAAVAMGVTDRTVRNLCRMPRVPLLYVRALNDAAAELAAADDGEEVA